MACEDDADACVSQSVAYMLIVADDGCVHELLHAMEVGEQGMVHHGHHLLAGLAGFHGFVAYPVERHVRQPAILARVDADDHQSGDGLIGVGEGGILAVGMLVIAIVGIQLGKESLCGYGDFGFLVTIVGDGIGIAQVMVAGNDQRMDACLTQLIEFADDILMAGQLAILGQVASNQHQLGLDVGLQLFHHGIEQLTALVQHLTVFGQVLLPGRAVINQQAMAHHMDIGDDNNLGLSLCHNSQGY